MPIKLTKQIKETTWKNFDNDHHPFLSYDFFLALEESNCIGDKSGWTPLYFEEKQNSLLYSFIKMHSYGEYIFDWDWANFYQQNNLPYYPKLTSMVPFTSATTGHFLGEQSPRLMETYENFYQEHSLSSSHFLFLQDKEIEFLKSYEYHIRHSFQYHFINENYRDFENFLSKLKGRKAKQIRKERAFPKNIQFQQFSAETLTKEHSREMFQFYSSTISKKGAIAYLNEDFFIKTFDKLKNNIVYVQATDEESPIAGTLFFFNESRLYGRYWGAIEEIPNLHFELCYYQGIEICLKKKLQVFEAGAQGEHKISRGFRPVKTYSAHKLKIPEIHLAIKTYIEDEIIGIDQLLPKLSEGLPFL